MVKGKRKKVGSRLPKNHCSCSLCGHLKNKSIHSKGKPIKKSWWLWKWTWWDSWNRPYDCTCLFYSISFRYCLMWFCLRCGWAFFNIFFSLQSIYDDVICLMLFTVHINFPKFRTQFFPLNETYEIRNEHSSILNVRIYLDDS